MKSGEAKRRTPAISKRAQATPASPMRKFLPLILDAERRGVEVIKLNVGDPDLDPPPAFLKEIRRFQGPQVPYAPSPGFRIHVDAWRSYYQSLGVRLEQKHIIPTVGCAEAIMLALTAVTDPGDDVIVFEPFYPSYKSFARMSGIALRPVTLRIENNYALPRAADIEKHIGRRTKAIVVINPGNPTGAKLTRTELRMVAAIAKRRRLFVIADETYRDIIFSGKPSTFLSFRDVRDRVIVIDSASKRFSLPGARIGCAVSYNEEVMAALLRFAMARLSAGTLEQFGLVPLLRRPRAYMRSITEEYRRRHDTILSALRKIPGVKALPAGGAFYLTVKLPVDDAEDFVAFMLRDFCYRKKTIALAPMSGFYWTEGPGKDAVRIAYVVGAKKLGEAAAILARGLEAYNASRHA